jgi:hypothetical protein
MAVVVAAVLAALGLLVLIGFVMGVLSALGLVMVDWADKAQSTALQRLMVVVAGLE